MTVKRILKVIIVCILIMIEGNLYGQNGTIDSVAHASVYLIRDTGLQGTLKPVHVFFNTEKVCKLNNNRYSKHAIGVGKYTIYVQSGGQKPKAKALKFDIGLETRKTYYVYLSAKPSKLGRNFYELVLGAIEEKFALRLINSMQEDKKCE